MLFMVAGYFKPGVEEQLIGLRNEVNEHLSQPYRPLAAAGVLRDQEGKRRGYMLFLEAGSLADAHAVLRQSPLYQEGLYERVDVLQFDVEVGQIG